MVLPFDWWICFKLMLNFPLQKELKCETSTKKKSIDIFIARSFGIECSKHKNHFNRPIISADFFLPWKLNKFYVEKKAICMLKHQRKTKQRKDICFSGFVFIFWQNNHKNCTKHFFTIETNVLLIWMFWKKMTMKHCIPWFLAQIRWTKTHVVNVHCTQSLTFGTAYCEECENSNFFPANQSTLDLHCRTVNRRLSMRKNKWHYKMIHKQRSEHNVELKSMPKTETIAIPMKYFSIFSELYFAVD